MKTEWMEKKGERKRKGAESKNGKRHAAFDSCSFIAVNVTFTRNWNLLIFNFSLLIRKRKLGRSRFLRHPLPPVTRPLWSKLEMCSLWMKFGLLEVKLLTFRFSRLNVSKMAITNVFFGFDKPLRVKLVPCLAS